MRILKKAIGFVLLMCAVNGLAFASRNTTEEMLQRAGVRGGLIVHLGCGDGVFTAQLYKGSNFLIHGLDLDPRNVKAARQRIQSMGLEGKVTADLYEDKVLPLIDNVVNLIIDDGTEARVSQAEMMRVLSPGGVALLKQKSSGATVTIAGEKWTILKKPVPPEIDEWTHYLHGPDNNAVSQDKVVGSPYHIQWAGNPVWTRSHNEMDSYSAIVSAGGRLFYILDEGPIQSIDLPPKWQMVARDAHNGIVLWKRDITAWEGHLRTFKSGPVELPRRLVASGDRVYVTLGYGGPLCILDAATGEDVKIVAGTEGAHEIIHSDGVLYLVSGKMDPAEYEQSMRTMSESPAIRNKSIIAVSETTGKLLWTKSDEDTHELLGTTMCADRGRLYFQGLDQLIALDKKTGNVSWRAKRPVELVRKTWAVPTVVVYNNVVFCAEGILKSSKQKASKGASGPLPTVSDSNQFSWTVTGDTSSQQVGECIAFDAENGKELWRCPAAYGYDSPPNVLVLGGLVWVSQVPLGRQTDMTEGRDPRTGEVKKVIDTAKAYDAPHHHRCYRDKATDDYMLLSRHGVEYVNVTTQEIQRHNWLRGTCQYGVMPANGLLYLPGDSCACYLQSRIPGLWALAPKRNTDITNASTGKKLTQGPAWGDIPAAPTTEPSDWPMHRHDNSRSGSTPVEVSANPVKLWQANLTGELTAPVIAGGKVIVAQKEKHIVTALDAAAGRQLWSFTAGGRIDSPPTISAGMVAFGSHDGYVYCLRISDGQMIWRFRAAPDDKRTVAFGQLESVWPVVGSVSVVGNTLYPSSTV